MLGCGPGRAGRPRRGLLARHAPRGRRLGGALRSRFRRSRPWRLRPWRRRRSVW